MQRANRVKHTRSTSSEIDHEFIVLEMWNSLTKEIYSVYIYILSSIETKAKKSTFASLDTGPFRLKLLVTMK